MELRNIKKSYDQRVILNNISCHFGIGMNVIVGDSGEGKSTLLNIMGLLEKSEEGQLFLGHEEIDSKNREYYLSDIIGFVFQDSNLVKGLTVMENIEIAVSMSNTPTDMSLIENYLKSFGIYERKDDLVDFLSGGEKQRVAVVRALAKGAAVILADEPTGNLDGENSKIIFDYLKQYSKDRIVIVITHNQKLAEEYGDRVYELSNASLNLKQGIQQGNQEVVYSKYSEKDQVISKKYLNLLTKNAVRRNKRKFISMSIALGFVIFLLGATFIMKTGVETKTEEMSETYYDLDQVDVYGYDISEISSAGELARENVNVPILQDTLDDIKNIGYFSEVVPWSGNIWNLSDGVTPIDVKPINLDSFFKNRIMTAHIEGNFPKDDKQIILGEDLESSLYGGDAIGKKLIIQNDYGNQVELTIVGVNHQNNVDGIYYNYISSNVLCNYTREPYAQQSSIFIGSTLERIYEQRQAGKNVSYSEDESGYFVSKLLDGKLIYGQEPSEDGQIVVSKNKFEMLYQLINDQELSLDDVDSDDEIWNASEVQKVFQETYYISANDAYEVSIVGVHDGNDDDILITKEYYNTIYMVHPVVLQCYVADKDILGRIREKSDIDGKSFYCYYSERFESVDGNNRIINMLFEIILCISIIAFIIVLNSFVKVSISDKRNDLGVLKALGARKKDVKKISIMDSVYLGFTAGGISAILMVAFSFVLPRIANMKISNYFVLILTCVALFLISVIVAALIAFIKMRKLVKEEIMDLLRKVE